MASLAFTSSRVAVRPSAGRRGTVRVAASVTAEKAALDITKMTPIHDRVLIRPIEEEQKTAGGILLPKAPPKANSDAHIGEVLAVGSDVTLAVAKGDMVVFQKYAMAEVEVKEGQIIFVAEKSIMGKLE
ncbi:hypothetical protein CHLRE_16g673729v5 [Chlamydomonas reinhardtii]|uniref:Uncharacterized protein n=2 Tax=Chlamydomonas reinhardtii TaxID=3055 RepID=A8J3C3_CHLRE|nr:uncharacterized protein CHLRE_16g673729v5 [Chlamydomonas reinhardtii]PNW72376.1 hypothetical protein CHLRE_16g673729v5 [Chlamydomonas reinhardtii]|eukprot:XP_001695900.1 chaperonin 11 [Chlamydomonas reinhardtii]